MRRLTIRVDQALLTIRSNRGYPEWSTEIEPHLEVSIKERKERGRDHEGRRTVDVFQDVHYGHHRVVRGIKSKKGAEKVRARLAAAIDRSSS